MRDSQDRGPGRGSRRTAVVLAGALAALLGCSRVLAADAPRDPLEHLNRATFAFNDALDRMLARPVARAYKAVVPDKARQVVSNFLSNLAYPTVIVNDALQAKFKDAGSDTLRFLSNTVIGVGGLFDPATRFGLPVHDEDFGQTLGAWGVPAGPYLVLPFLGPSDARDAPARAVDYFTRGDYYLRYSNSDAVSSTTTEYALYGLRLIDLRTSLLATDETLQQSFDRYAVVRNAYIARREYLVRDGNVPEETYDEPESDAGTPAPAPPPVQPPAAQAQPATPPPPQPPEGTQPREPLP